MGIRFSPKRTKANMFITLHNFPQKSHPLVRQTSHNTILLPHNYALKRFVIETTLERGLVWDEETVNF